MKQNLTQFLTLAALVFVLSGHGQTVTWTGAGNGSSWTDAANWNAGAVPGSANDVLITSGLGSYVIISGNVTVSSLQCSKGLKLTGGSLTLLSGRSLISGPLAIDGGANLTVNGGLASLTANGVATVSAANFYALNGGVLHLLSLSSATNNQNITWRADGSGSLLDLSALTNLVIGFYNRTYVQAYNGATVDLHRLSDTASAVTIDAQDAGSIVDLSGLAGRWSSQTSGPLDLSVQGGAFLLIPNVTQLEHALLTIQGTGGVPTAQINLLTNASLTVDGTAPNFGMLTNIDDTSVYALNGGIARLTNVARMFAGDLNPTWRADGAGSLIDLSRLTVLTQAYYQRVYLQAYNGGTLDLHRLSDTASAVTIDAQDAGSIVDLSGLAGRWSSQTSGPLDLSVQGGAFLLIPNVTQLEHALLTVQGTGGVPTAQMNLLTNVSLTVDGTAPDFGMLTNIDDTSVYALNGGIARLTNVVRMFVGDLNPTWQADGAGSLVDLSMLTDLSQGFYERVYIQAYNGGKVDLRKIGTVCSGAVQILADGAGSSVDLTGLSSLLGFGSGPSSITAKNGGATLVNDRALLLANTTISVSPGNSILPPALVATDALTLCAKPWQSYWLEERDVTQLDSPWTLLMRVVPTNSTQLVSFQPTPNTALRIRDFASAPPILELIVSPDSQLQLFFYGANNKTYQILTATNLSSEVTWEPGPSVVMTNGFSILPVFPASDATRFYRAKEL